jgi:hypothetical protein
VQIHTGGLVEIIENGASSWSATADGKLPGTPEAVVVVRVTVDDPDAIDRVKLEELVLSSKPAHVVHRIEVTGSGERGKGKSKADAPAPLDVATVAADAKAEAKKASKESGDEVTPTAKADSVPAAEAAATAEEAGASEASADDALKASASKAAAAPAEAAPAAEAPPAAPEKPADAPPEKAEGDEPKT